jgi:uncharacterized cupredoxin-like copper-binding protein
MTRNRTVWAIVIVCVLAGLLAGCGGDSKPTAVAASAQEPGAKHFTFAGLPSSVKAGRVDLTLKNTGKQPHDLQLLKFDGDHTLEEFLPSVEEDGAPIPPWAHAEGGVSTAAPGKSLTASLNLPPGKYAYFCTEGEGDEAHAKLGMTGELSVTGKASTKALPDADASVGAHEYGFDVKGLKAGSQTVKFTNTGKELHHFFMAKIAAGKTFADAKASFLAPPEQQQQGPPPLDFDTATGVEVHDPGTSEVATINLKAGDYVMLCFINDRSGGPPHFTKGMLQEVKVS